MRANNSDVERGRGRNTFASTAAANSQLGKILVRQYEMKDLMAVSLEDQKYSFIAN